jgi:hypothetical protein
LHNGTPTHNCFWLTLGPVEELRQPELSYEVTLVKGECLFKALLLSFDIILPPTCRC